MKSTNALLICLLIFCAALNCVASEKQQQSENMAALESDPVANLLKQATVEERKETQLLVAQEQMEISSINKKGGMSESKKQSMIDQVRSNFVEKRNAVRLQIRRKYQPKILKAQQTQRGYK